MHFAELQCIVTAVELLGRLTMVILIIVHPSLVLQPSIISIVPRLSKSTPIVRHLPHVISGCVVNFISILIVLSTNIFPISILCRLGSLSITRSCSRPYNGPVTESGPLYTSNCSTDRFCGMRLLSIQQVILTLLECMCLRMVD